MFTTPLVLSCTLSRTRRFHASFPQFPRYIAYEFHSPLSLGLSSKSLQSPSHKPQSSSLSPVYLFLPWLPLDTKKISLFYFLSFAQHDYTDFHNSLPSSFYVFSPSFPHPKSLLTFIPVPCPFFIREVYRHLPDPCPRFSWLPDRGKLAPGPVFINPPTLYDVYKFGPRLSEVT